MHFLWRDSEELVSPQSQKLRTMTKLRLTMWSILLVWLLCPGSTVADIEDLTNCVDGLNVARRAAGLSQSAEEGLYDPVGARIEAKIRNCGLMWRDVRLIEGLRKNLTECHGE